jgi:hypothetical protein
MTVTTYNIYDIAHNYYGENNPWNGFTYSTSWGDLYNMNYYRGRPRYLGGWGYFPSGEIHISDFYNSDGNCNCDCDCACDCNCACDCDCAC